MSLLRQIQILSWVMLVEKRSFLESQHPTSTFQPVAEYMNEDGTYKSADDIKKMWAENQISGDKHVAFYCGTAWRSSLAFIYALELGWPRVSNFDSSWFEWSMGPEKDQNPVE